MHFRVSFNVLTVHQGQSKSRAPISHVDNTLLGAVEAESKPDFSQCFPPMSPPHFHPFPMGASCLQTAVEMPTQPQA